MMSKNGTPSGTRRKGRTARAGQVARRILIAVMMSTLLVIANLMWVEDAGATPVAFLAFDVFGAVVLIAAIGGKKRLREFASAWIKFAPHWLAPGSDRSQRDADRERKAPATDKERDAALRRTAAAGSNFEDGVPASDNDLPTNTGNIPTQNH